MPAWDGAGSVRAHSLASVRPSGGGAGAAESTGFRHQLGAEPGSLLPHDETRGTVFDVFSLNDHCPIVAARMMA